MQLSHLALISPLLVTLLSGCSSNHNLRDGDSSLGGGYQTIPVNTSIYYIYVRTNPAIVARHDTAKEMFMRQARDACNSDNIGIVNGKTQIYHSKFDPLIVTETLGYAVCLDDGQSDVQIRTSISDYEQS